MREHQININLKAQQFELLQKLAREKGYKSVSAFVREKVMELAFGLEPQGQTAGQSSGAVSLDGEVVKELSRIHNEMQQFIKESLGLGADAQMPHGVLAADLQNNSQSDQIASDWPAQSAGGKDAFDLAMGLGGNQPINVVPPFDVNSLADDLSFLAGSTTSSESFYDDQYLDQQAQAVDNRAANQVAADAFFNTGAAKSGSESIVTESNQAIFSSNSNLGGFAYSLGNYSNFGGNSFVARFGGTSDAGGDRLSGYKEILDDLEELADRAFAISPRLGSLTEDAGEQPDAAAEAPKVAADGGSGRRAAHHSAPVPSQTVQKPELQPEPTNFAAPAPPPEVMPAAPVIAAPVASVPTPIPIPTLTPVQATLPLNEPEASVPAVSSALPQTAAMHQPVHFDPLMAAEDDLLDDLLDGDLLAQAHAPRETNPFAVDLPFGNYEQDAQNIENFGPLDAEMSEDAAMAAAPEQLQLEQIDSPVAIATTVNQDDLSALVPAQPALDANHASVSQPSAIPVSEAEPVSSAKDDIGAQSASDQTNISGDSTTANQPNQSGYQEESPGYFQVDSQDANSMGVSGLSGGPPPKRRRS
ncbi:MAG: hypothetical protein IPP57_08315 [Candidatus Obscuribacter sp.]|nr:hypothetical protein [Candidatus Obscuribacter sp.]